MPDDQTEVVDPEAIPVATGRTPTPTAKTFALGKPSTLEIELGDSEQVLEYFENIVRQLKLKKIRNEPMRVRLTITID